MGSGGEPSDAYSACRLAGLSLRVLNERQALTAAIPVHCSAYALRNSIRSRKQNSVGMVRVATRNTRLAVS
jgi:hypothetical protein